MAAGVVAGRRRSYRDAADRRHGSSFIPWRRCPPNPAVAISCRVASPIGGTIGPTRRRLSNLTALHARAREATRSALPGGGYFFLRFCASYTVIGAGGRQRRSRCLVSSCRSLPKPSLAEIGTWRSAPPAWTRGRGARPKSINDGGRIGLLSELGPVTP